MRVKQRRSQTGVDWRGITEEIWTLRDSVGPIATQDHQTATRIDPLHPLSPSHRTAKRRAPAFALLRPTVHTPTQEKPKTLTVQPMVATCREQTSGAAAPGT
jgi:hypothetical protein